MRLRVVSRTSAEAEWEAHSAEYVDEYDVEYVKQYARGIAQRFPKRCVMVQSRSDNCGGWSNESLVQAAVINVQTAPQVPGVHTENAKSVISDLLASLNAVENSGVMGNASVRSIFQRQVAEARRKAHAWFDSVDNDS